ncbi:MAG: F0F1 ATP synthase subunit B [Fimbriimonadaceae bacterium]|nr:F0F1 ATP synthase subunit B [Fimbriimonadaceae bacterium]
MSTEHKSSSASTWIGIVLGLVLMPAGFYVSTKVDIAFQNTLREGGIPLDLGKTVSAIGVLLILFPVIRSFFINALADAINGRTQDLERTFAEAEDLRAEMTQMRTDYERRLVQTEAEAREQIQHEIRRAQELRQELEQKAREQADQFLTRAKEDIEVQRHQAIADIRTQVVELTLQATEKLIEANVDDERNRKLLDEFLVSVEVPR